MRDSKHVAVLTSTLSDQSTRPLSQRAVNSSPFHSFVCRNRHILFPLCYNKTRISTPNTQNKEKRNGAPLPPQSRCSAESTCQNTQGKKENRDDQTSKKARLLKRRRRTSQKHKYHLLTHSIKETATIIFKRGKVPQASPSTLAALLPLRCACKMSLFSAKGQA